MSFFSQTFGVIVLYNTRIEDSKTIFSLNNALQFNGEYLNVLIYDNSPERTEGRTNFEYKRLRIYYVHDSSNGGVSVAYNFGAKYAKNVFNAIWVLLLDQDTSFPIDIFSKFSNSIKKNPDIKLFAPILMTMNNVIFSPCKYYMGRGFPLKMVSSGISSFKNISPVNSGMLINLEQFSNAGMFNENVRLDFSDFQFIERFKRIESFFFIIDAIALQDFSNNETDINKLNKRFEFFCEGAKNSERLNVLDNLKYFIVVFMRATTLFLRTKKAIFFRTFFQFYMKTQ